MDKSRLYTVKGKILVEGNRTELLDNEIFVDQYKDKYGNKLVEFYENSPYGQKKLNEIPYKKAFYKKGSYTQNYLQPKGNYVLVIPCIKYPVVVLLTTSRDKKVEGSLKIEYKDRDPYLIHFSILDIPDNLDKKLIVEFNIEDLGYNSTSKQYEYKVEYHIVYNENYYFVNSKFKAVIRNGICEEFTGNCPRIIHALPGNLQEEGSYIFYGKVIENKLRNDRYRFKNIHKLIHINKALQPSESDLTSDTEMIDENE